MHQMLSPASQSNIFQIFGIASQWRGLCQTGIAIKGATDLNSNCNFVFGSDYGAEPGISKPGCGVMRSIQRLCFMVSPYSGVMSSISPGIPLNFNLWRRMARNRKTSARPMDSPMQRRFPSPKTNTFSPSILFRTVPSALRNRSGLKLEGSFHSSLQEETDSAASFKSALHHLSPVLGVTRVT